MAGQPPWLWPTIHGRAAESCTRRHAGMPRYKDRRCSQVNGGRRMLQWMRKSKEQEDRETEDMEKSKFERRSDRRWTQQTHGPTQGIGSHIEHPRRGSCVMSQPRKGERSSDRRWTQRTHKRTRGIGSYTEHPHRESCAMGHQRKGGNQEKNGHGSRRGKGPEEPRTKIGERTTRGKDATSWKRTEEKEEEEDGWTRIGTGRDCTSGNKGGMRHNGKPTMGGDE